MAAGSTSGQPTVRRWQRGVTPSAGGDAPPAVRPPLGSVAASMVQGPDDGELFDRIVDALEERVIAELERRGRRHFPGVF